MRPPPLGSGPQRPRRVQRVRASVDCSTCRYSRRIRSRTRSERLFSSRAASDSAIARSALETQRWICSGRGKAGRLMCIMLVLGTCALGGVKGGSYTFLTNGSTSAPSGSRASMRSMKSRASLGSPAFIASTAARSSSATVGGSVCLNELERPAKGFEVETFRACEGSGDVAIKLVFSCDPSSQCVGFNSRWGRKTALECAPPLAVASTCPVCPRVSRASSSAFSSS